MLRVLTDWVERRRRIRLRWQQDARVLIAHNERQAYYEAQRLAARNRVQGNRPEFWHWSKVASEIARLSPVTEMDMKVVEAIVDEEMRGYRHS